jgi:DNA-binding transcriptional ArsR family regulator
LQKIYCASILFFMGAPLGTIKRLDDAGAMRALAHPLRLRLLGLLRSEGPATASVLASAVDEAIPLASYHLRKLAEHGFIEEAPELARDGRERPWRAVHEFTSWSLVDFLDSPERLSAAAALQREILRRHVETIEAFFAEAPAWTREWLDASDNSDLSLYLTAAELRTMRDEIWKVLELFRARGRRPHTERVEAILYLLPRQSPPK